jgi:hypothetical protein
MLSLHSSGTGELKNVLISAGHCHLTTTLGYRVYIYIHIYTVNVTYIYIYIQVTFTVTHS